MGEGGSGGGVGQVVGGNVDSLNGSDGTFFGGGDTLLQGAHFRCQCGLIADGGGHTAEQCGYLGTGLGEAEDVVDEQQHVLMLHITEVLCHGQAGQAHAHTGSWRFVHLTEDHGGLGNNAGLGHFVVQVVTLTGTLANAGEDGIAIVGSGDVVNQFLNQNGLANARAAEQTDLTALGIGADQVDDLDAGFQNLGSGLLLLVGGSGTVDGPALDALYRRFVVNGLTQQVKYTSQALFANGNGDRRAGVGCLGAALQAVRGGHGDTANHIVADVLCDLRHDGMLAVGNLDGAEQTGQLIVSEADVKNRTHDLDHSSFVFGHWEFNSFC